MGNRLNQLMNAVDLREVISTETEEKLAANETVVAPIVSQNGDFHEREVIQKEPEPIYIEEEEPYDAEANARAVVTMLECLDSMTVVPIATYKTKKRYGGVKGIKRMQAVVVKKMMGEKLTEEDERLLAVFNEYKRDLEVLQIDFCPSKQRTEELVRLATPWCAQSKIKMGAASGFLLKVVAIKVEQITKILLK